MVSHANIRVHPTTVENVLEKRNNRKKGKKKEAARASKINRETIDKRACSLAYAQRNRTVRFSTQAQRVRQENNYVKRAIAQGQGLFCVWVKSKLCGIASGASTGVGVAPGAFVGRRRCVKLELHAALMGNCYS